MLRNNTEGAGMRNNLKLSISWERGSLSACCCNQKDLLIIYITWWNLFFLFLRIKRKAKACNTTHTYSKRRLSKEIKNTHSSGEQPFCYPEALYLHNSSSFAIPRASKKKICPRWAVKMNALEISFSVWDSGAFLFVSPLELSLPWEPCGPGNKQSFVRADPLCPAARL